jgi:predicted Co/Zn/Cd cation transporter (cation efflux family)
MKKKLFIDLNFIVDIENYKKSMEKWLLIRKRYEGKLVES